MRMSSGKVETALETVQRRFRSILETNSSVVIARAKSTLNESTTAFRKQRSRSVSDSSIRPWGYTIPQTDPLRFLPTEVKGIALRVDMFLKSYWVEDPATTPSELNVVVRVWCLDKRIYFRPGLDAEQIDESIDPHVGRVMIRFHFDLANVTQQGPIYHLQIGGKSRPEEASWLPESLTVPRFIHAPVDLVLAAELIAANFYPDEFADIRREPSWVGSRNASQGHLLDSYYTQALTAVKDGDSVLESLWNIPWNSA